jgi:flavin-dependent dehydrogenase
MKAASSFINKKRSSLSPAIALEDGDHVAVMGGGPAGSLFAYFLLDMAQRTWLELQVDIYEPRDFSLLGPTGCNMCAGILSESLIQMLAVDGINLPHTMVQRGMDTYLLHTNIGKTHLQTPNLEKRIGTVFRGSGPLRNENGQRDSFDGFLLEQAVNKGANLIRSRVEEVRWVENLLQIKPRGGLPRSYHLLGVATGINTNALRMFSKIETSFQPPESVKTFVREYYLGREIIESRIGSHTIHFFLLDQPGLDFAAVVPKDDFVTVTVLGLDVSKENFETFLKSKELKACMPPVWQPERFACHCSPRMNVTGAKHPFSDRIVFIGDSGVSRLYKDGIGAAYRTAKYAAATAVFTGISKEDFRRHYWRSSRAMHLDNYIGKFIFAIIRRIKPQPLLMWAMMRMVENEHTKPAGQRRMSSILWDMFTGSAPYRDIFMRFFYPRFWGSFLWHVGSSLFRRRQNGNRRFRKGILGRRSHHSSK